MMAGLEFFLAPHDPLNPDFGYMAEFTGQYKSRLRTVQITQRQADRLMRTINLFLDECITDSAK